MARRRVRESLAKALPFRLVRKGRVVILATLFSFVVPPSSICGSCQWCEQSGPMQATDTVGKLSPVKSFVERNA